jgi:predicted nucleotidyltransferase
MAKHMEVFADFVDTFVSWASSQQDIEGIALVGSYARGTARGDSDIDFVILTGEPEKYLESTLWAERFGKFEKQQVEDYGMLTSLRIWHLGGFEVEYGFTTPAWAAFPLDAGTREVINSGMIVLFERGNLLSQHIHRRRK